MILILLPSQTRFCDVGRLTEPGPGYSIFYKERPSTERQGARVGFAIRMQLVKLSELPLFWSDNITSFTTSAKPIYDGDKYMLRLL